MICDISSAVKAEYIAVIHRHADFDKVGVHRYISLCACKVHKADVAVYLVIGVGYVVYAEHREIFFSLCDSLKSGDRTSGNTSAAEHIAEITSVFCHGYGGAVLCKDVGRHFSLFVVFVIVR